MVLFKMAICVLVTTLLLALIAVIIAMIKDLFNDTY